MTHLPANLKVPEELYESVRAVNQTESESKRRRVESRVSEDAYQTARLSKVCRLPSGLARGDEVGSERRDGAAATAEEKAMSELTRSASDVRMARGRRGGGGGAAKRDERR